MMQLAHTMLKPTEIRKGEEGERGGEVALSLYAYF